MPLNTAEIFFKKRRAIALTLIYFALLSLIFIFCPTSLFGYFVYNTFSMSTASWLLFLFLIISFFGVLLLFDKYKQFWLLPRVFVVIILDCLLLPVFHKYGFFNETTGYLWFLLIILFTRAIVIFLLHKNYLKYSA